MDIQQEYKRWSAYAEGIAQLAQLMAQVGDDADIADRFYKQLSFGTGGMRGKLGAGTNRMNIFTVGKATQGLAEYICERYEAPSACIAYDTRNMSREFAQTAAGVLCANGVKVYLFETTHPTPMLSYAVRYLKAACGIVITASHNPKEYNGYKVYGETGGQITDEAANAITACIAQNDVFEDVKLMPLEQALVSGQLELMPPQVDETYYAAVEQLVLRKNMVRESASQLAVLYTPLHGSGNIPVRSMLTRLGYTQLHVVPEQELPDGDFPTAPYPNPEDPSVFALAISHARNLQPDLIFATDPDCDRIGVLVRGDCEYVVLTGNQTGALLCDYVLRTQKELGTLPKNAAVVSTVVTSDLARRVCEANDTAYVQVLTGFKYIAEQIERWEQTGEHTFEFGYEESYGYLAGTFVRDKDAVIASVLVAEMALYYKNNGKTLYDALQELYARYGWVEDKLISVTLPGQDGQAQMEQLMEDLRTNYAECFTGETITMLEDFLAQERFDFINNKKEKIELPRSNVLKFYFADGAFLALRPSGTEPKIKLYLCTPGQTQADAAARMQQLAQKARAVLQKDETS